MKRCLFLSATLSLLLFASVFGHDRCRFEDEVLLHKKFTRFQTDCLDKGFQESTLVGCSSTVEKTMKKQNILKKCRNLNKYLGRCGVFCGDRVEEQEEVLTLASAGRGLL